jgi:hypothetical protein
MGYLPQLLALAGVWTIVVISPGPDFVATVHHAVSRSRRDGLLVALGISTGTEVDPFSWSARTWKLSNEKNVKTLKTMVMRDVIRSI